MELGKSTQISLKPLAFTVAMLVPRCRDRIKQILETRTSQELRVVRFADEKIQMIVLKVNSEDFDFTNPEQIRAIAEGALDLKSSGLEILKGDRDYRADKKMEVFVMMEEGARPCKEVFWKSIQRMIPPEGSTPAS